MVIDPSIERKKNGNPTKTDETSKKAGTFGLSRNKTIKFIPIINIAVGRSKVAHGTESKFWFK
jgi:hypothetical protein